jgi:hypothetical protein
LQHVVILVIDGMRMKFTLIKKIRKQNERRDITLWMRILNNSKLNGQRKDVRKDKLNELVLLNPKILLNLLYLLLHLLVNHMNEIENKWTTNQSHFSDIFSNTSFLHFFNRLISLFHHSINSPFLHFVISSLLHLFISSFFHFFISSIASFRHFFNFLILRKSNFVMRIICCWNICEIHFRFNFDFHFVFVSFDWQSQTFILQTTKCSIFISSTVLFLHPIIHLHIHSSFIPLFLPSINHNHHLNDNKNHYTFNSCSIQQNSMVSWS